jgi:succinate dehydrogenase / fumarate reductase membrane anchor subunit
MVKSVLGVNHRGLTDWLIQRVSAVIMVFYSVGMIVYFFKHPNLNFITWHTLFSYSWIKIATILFVSSLLLHAWIGLWTVFTDYVKPFLLTVFLNGLVFFSLAACFVWALQILWGV